MEGWIKLHRKIQDHWIYQEKRKFSRYEAWLDMIMMANHKGNRFLHGSELVEVERGQFITSELKLMDRWDWGKNKLRLFLDLLEKDGMIIKKTDRKRTAITICNYGLYHDSETKDGPQADQSRTDSGPSADTNKNVKNDKNEEEVLNDDDKAFAQVVDFYQRNIGQMPPSQYEYVKDWLNTFESEVLLLAIRRALDNGVPKWTYVNQTLKEWQRYGARTVEDCKAQIVEFDRQKGERHGKHQESNGRVRPGKASGESEFAFLDRQNRTGS